MKKPDSKKLLTRAVIVILCFFFVGGVIYGGYTVFNMEGTMPPNTFSEKPDSTAQIVDYLNGTISTALTAKPKLSSSVGFDIDSDSIALSPESSLMLSTVKFVRDDICDAVEDAAEMPEADFSEGFDNILKELSLTPDDIVSAKCIYEYYECLGCSEEFEMEYDVCPECGSTAKQLLVLKDEYNIHIEIKPDSTSFKNNFTVRSSSDMKKIVDDNCDGFLNCGDIEVKYTESEINAKVNRFTDKLEELKLKAKAEVSVSLTFEESYSSLGNTTASFTVTDEYRYDPTWPSLILSSDELTLEHGANEVLKATLTCDDPTAYKIRWASSDESIATVDEDGYIQAKKNDGSVTITAEFDFLGVTYKDSCKVNVLVVVEGLRLSEKNLKMKTGEQFKLTATTKPKKASIQTVTWHSEDEAVVTVSPDGTLTAVSPGTVTVYALSDDGYFKSTCKVEVTM